MNLADAMKQRAAMKLTENNAVAYSTTQNPLLDLFGVAGSLRSRSDVEIMNMYETAFYHNPFLAFKLAFHTGNIRGGLGERRTFQIMLKWLALNEPGIMQYNIKNIPHFNRWDSLFVLEGTPVEDALWDITWKQLQEDIENMKKGLPISLLAKWLPSSNASSSRTKERARLFIRKWGITERTYRKTLSLLRSHLRVTEKLMSSQEWNKIEYGKVPSYAMKNYRNAFSRNDAKRWVNYLADIKSGKEKVNASVLYPYDLVAQVREGRNQETALIEAQWKALPDYLEGNDTNIMVMADVSGSMYCSNGRPMNTSIGLAIYFAQRTKSAFKNCYMTFTDQPHIVNFANGAPLQQLVREVKLKGVGYNTNLEAAFVELLVTAIQMKVPNSEMPKAILVISDMEIDRVLRREGTDFVEGMRREYASYGYLLPQLICWNVEARQNTFLSQEKDVLLVSGQSPSVFKNMIKGIGKTAEELMVETLNDPMYDCLII